MSLRNIENKKGDKDSPWQTPLDVLKKQLFLPWSLLISNMYNLICKQSGKWRRNWFSVTSLEIIKTSSIYMNQICNHIMSDFTVNLDKILMMPWSSAEKYIYVPRNERKWKKKKEKVSQTNLFSRFSITISERKGKNCLSILFILKIT